MKYIHKGVEPSSLSIWKIKQGAKIPRWKSAEFFKYSTAGEILPTEESSKKLAAETTIENLSLNIPKLQRMRQAAIDAELELLDNDDFNEEEIINLIKDYSELNDEGKYQPFCATIVYILENYYL
jgi:hypothetical protein